MVFINPLIKDLEHSPTLLTNEVVHGKRLKGENVLHMGFGEAPFPVHKKLITALSEAASRKDYLPAGGLQDLKYAVKEYYKSLLGENIMEQYDVIIAPGSKLVLYALFMAIDGDLLMPIPSWVSYGPQAHMLGQKLIKFPAKLDSDGYHINVNQLKHIIEKARLEGMNPSKLILNSPNNPTGLVIPDQEMESIASLCRKENIFIISDEIYGQLQFNSRYSSISKYSPDNAAITTGLSKHLSLGGWRLGIGLIPKNAKNLYKALCRISSETWSSVSSPIQAAAIEAYKRDPEIEQYIEQCREIHKYVNTFIAKSLNELGIECSMPNGAFYTYPNFNNYRDELEKCGIFSCEDLKSILLEKYNLASLPANAFGDSLSNLSLRLSGCDYDGKKAIEAYQSGASLDIGFIHRYAPNIVESIETFGRFLSNLTQEIKVVNS